MGTKRIERMNVLFGSSFSKNSDIHLMTPRSAAVSVAAAAPPAAHSTSIYRPFLRSCVTPFVKLQALARMTIRSSASMDEARIRIVSTFSGVLSITVLPLRNAAIHRLQPILELTVTDQFFVRLFIVEIVDVV